MELNAPLKDFIPVVRGNTLRNAPRELDKAKIYSAQLMLSKYEYDGGFSFSFLKPTRVFLLILSAALALPYMPLQCLFILAGALNPNFAEGPFNLDFGSLRALK